MIRLLFGWLFAPYGRAQPFPVGTRVKLATFMPLVPVGSYGVVKAHCKPGLGFLVRWENGQSSVTFVGEVTVLE